MTELSMTKVIEPRSDQVNSDDFMSGPRTFKIEGVSIKPGQEQPVEIALQGSKPWRPCKSMSRVLVAAWGADAKNYTGKSVTLYRDPSVKWGGLEVGGIRVSHLSDIANPMTMALTATKGSRKPYTVKPLVVKNEATKEPKAAIDAMKNAANMQALTDAFSTEWANRSEYSEADFALIIAAKDQRKADLSAPEPGSEG